MFSEPVAALNDGLYVVFAFPVGQHLVDAGLGGGPAVGYAAAAIGSPGWLSGEGEIWARLHEDYSFVVLPLLVPVEDDMLVKRMGGEAQDKTPEIEPFLAGGSNPFNLGTEISFGIRE